MSEETQGKTYPAYEERRGRIYFGPIIFIICFIIGCLFLYWAVEYYVYNTFDHSRYELAKIQVNGTDSLSVWKLDRRTGGLEYCTKSYDKLDNFICVRAASIDAKEYTPPPEVPPASSQAVKPASDAQKPAEKSADKPAEKPVTEGPWVPSTSPTLALPPTPPAAENKPSKPAPATHKKP